MMVNKYSLVSILIFSIFSFKFAHADCSDSMHIEVEDSDFLNYEEIYHYGKASGDIHFFTSNDGFNKPVIVVEGLDIKNRIDCYDIVSQLQAQQPIISELNAQEKDVVIVDFDNSKRLIEENGVLLSKIIGIVNDLKEGDHSNAVIGLSMGGLVSRFALARYEHYKGSHDVFLFVSYDSPQKFANLSQTLQAWLHFGASSASDRMELYRTLGSPSVKQMLVTRNLISYDETGTIAIFDAVDYNTKLMDKLAGFGNYPGKLRKIAFSNGNAQGEAYDFVSGDPIMIIRGDIGSWSGVTAEAVGISHYNTFLECMADMNYVELEQVTSVPAGCALTGFYPEAIGENPQLAQVSFDNAPGSYSYSLVDAVTEVVTNIGYTIENPQPETSFIPTISALDIDTSDLFYDIQGDAEILDKTPFDKLYYPSNGINEEHLELTDEKYDQLMEEIAQYHRPKNLDYDKDGISNGIEISLGSEMLDSDTDGDGMKDGFEYRYSFPFINSKTDGLDNGTLCSGTNVLNNGTGPGDDADCDTLTNLVEHGWGSNPKSSDSDNDNIGDAEEVAMGRHPAVNEPAMIAIVNGLLI